MCSVRKHDARFQSVLYHVKLLKSCWHEFQFRALIGLTTLKLIFRVLQLNYGNYKSFSPTDSTIILHMMKYHHFLAY